MKRCETCLHCRQPFIHRLFFVAPDAIVDRCRIVDGSDNAATARRTVCHGKWWEPL